MATNPKQSFAYDSILKKLTVRHAASFPQEVFDYAADVEILDMSYGHITSLPDSIGKLTKLRIAFLSHNDFEEMPAQLAFCENLEMVGLKSCKISSISEHALPTSIRGLILTDNRLSSLPSSLGTYTNLQKLMLAGNQLQSLPESILMCQNLQLLRLAGNKCTTSPDWLFQLPKLGWYTDAGNLFHGTDRIHAQGLKEISWRDIVFGEKLGESANNKVYKAKLSGGEDVAVKMYGAGITTDGDPLDDMNACLLAGVHPNIIGGIGKIVDAPENAQGLVMPLVPNTFKKLGDPPDLKTLTRDVYPRTESFSLPYILQVLKDVASAMHHCHRKGIMHGDIYAHNVLSSPSGQSYIGDFGAASLYNPETAGGKLREQVDVKGFGYLIEDLLNNSVDDQNQNTQKKLQEVLERCLEPNVTNRPTFADIHGSLLP
ncbi:MAG: protein kinase [Candidatus Levybacteria bacterium]|nr:protein kinase [Candidatus Levybacteria bacterium]